MQLNFSYLDYAILKFFWYLKPMDQICKDFSLFRFLYPLGINGDS